MSVFESVIRNKIYHRIWVSPNEGDFSLSFLIRFVSFLVVANICPEDVKHPRAAGVGIVVLFFCRCALLQTWMALVFPNPLFELELPHRSKEVVGGHQPPQK